MERLKKIPCFMLSYQDMICEKCSLRGDPRYLYYKCHCNPKPHHPKPLEQYHPMKLESFHPLNTHVTHLGEVLHRHPGTLVDYHPQEMISKEIDDEDNPIYDHPGRSSHDSLPPFDLYWTLSTCHHTCDLHPFLGVFQLKMFLKHVSESCFQSNCQFI